MAEMSSADEVVQKSLKSFGDDFYNRYLRQSILYNWSNIVGEVNAAKIKPLRIEYKKLFVYVSDGTWKANLFAYKNLFIQKINEYVKTDLIDDIQLGRPNEKPKKDDNNITVIEESEEDKIQSEIKRITLTENEFEEIKQNLAYLEDDELRENMIKASVSRLKLKKYRLSKNWHNCKMCNTLCPPEQTFCNICLQKRSEDLRYKITQILKEVPWSSYADVINEIKKTMPDMESKCLPETVESVRTSLIQRISNSIDLNNQKQLSLLVMLYTRRPADQLNQDIIDKTLYKLRYDLPVNAVDFKTLRLRKSKRPTN